MNLVSTMCLLSLALTLGSSAPEPPVLPAPRMAGDNGAPWLLMEPMREVPTTWHGAASVKASLDSETTRGLSLATADFDEDGMPDVVAGYDSGSGGSFALHRGNVDAVYPNAPEAQERKKAGTFTSAPFLPDADLFETPERVDFIGAGDFDADGHWDVVTASRGGESLWLHLGDGKGGFAQAERIALAGRVTAFATGEINRRDGLTDLVVGVNDASEARALVFEGPDGALRREPEVLALPSPATDFVLDRLDEDWALDLAVAAGSQLVIAHGRDRKLSYELAKGEAPTRPAEIETIELPFEIETLAVGDFDEDREQELALLDTDGALHVRPAREAKKFAEETAGDRIGTPAATAWKGTRSPAATEQRRARLLAVRLSTLPGDDLLLMDRTGRELHVRLAAGERPDGPNAQEVREAAGTWASQQMPSQGAALLPMRLNSDALTDLAVLSEGASGLGAFEPGIASVFVVTNTNDSGTGSLRDAIAQANAAAGADTITFNIAGAGVHVIHILGGITVSEAVTIDGTTQPGYAGSPLVEVEGDLPTEPAYGLRVTGGSSTIRGLALSQHYRPTQVADGGAISISVGGSNIVEGCYIGTNAAGTIAKPNGFNSGVYVGGAGGNRIGGTTAAARNIISGNDAIEAVGIVASGSNVVLGNYFGTDPTGLNLIPNSAHGARLVGVTSTTIGGTAAGSRNVFAAELSHLTDDYGSSDTLIQGNYIGVAADGVTTYTTAPGLIRGIAAGDTTDLLIGGTTSVARNVIAGNTEAGILSVGPTPPTAELIQGNFVGTDSAGAAAVPNGVGIMTPGEGALIGGVGGGQGNVISGNGSEGILLAVTSGVSVQGNLIGLSVTGNSAIPNGTDGIRVESDGHAIGGPTGTNFISGNNLGSGVRLTGSGASGNTLQSNYIGMDVTGSVALSNGNGVRIEAGAHDNFIGLDSASGNIISGNGIGILVIGSSSTGNSIRGNLIGLDDSGSLPLGNVLQGIHVSGAGQTTIGGAAAGERNVISASGAEGILIEGAPNVVVRGNFIGTDQFGTSAVPNATGIHVTSGSTNTQIGTGAGLPNVISGNSGSGVLLDGTATTGITLKGNYIGTDLTGEIALGNSGFGIEIIQSGGHTIGGPMPGDRNLICCNSSNSMWIQEVGGGSGLAGITVEGNWLGLSASRATVLGNSGTGIIALYADDSGFRDNVVVGSSLSGISLLECNRNTLTGNWIGMTPDPDFTPAGNGSAGISISGAGSSDNVIGHPTDPFGWNIIAFSGGAGLRITGGMVRNAISGNYFVGNGGLGIDLGDDGVTPNDPGDADTGPNNLQNFPVLTSATTTGGSISVTGTLDSTPSTSFTIPVFLSYTCDPSGYGEASRVPLGSIPVTTDGAGIGSFSETFLDSSTGSLVVTALATDPAGNSSEFSMCTTAVGVPPAPPVSGGFSSAPGESSVLSWPESPGATLYHVYAGSAPTVSSLVSAPLDSCEVGTTNSTSYATAVTDIPPPGGMLWYLIRPEGPYGLGEVGESSSGARSQDSIGACGGSCAHDTCATGVALTSPCDPCVAMIAAVDPYCVNSNWDSFCVAEVRSVCGSMRCTPSKGTCAHPLCGTGVALTAGCDVPPLSSSCVADICAVDSYCCTTAWDSVCVDEVATVCSLGCL